MTELQARIAALPAQLRALVAGMDAWHYGPRKIVEAAADELEHGQANHCLACGGRWRGAENVDRLCPACVSGVSALVERIRARAANVNDISRVAWDIFGEIADASQPIEGQEVRLYSLGHACPLCGAVTRAGSGFTRYGLRGHLFGRQSPCPITALVQQQLTEWREERWEAQNKAAEKRAAAPRPEYCYLVQCGTTGNVKIGKANDVAKRLSDLQRGTGTKLTLLGSIETEDGLTLESQMHARFAAHRLHGEWFSSVPAILEAFGLPSDG